MNTISYRSVSSEGATTAVGAAQQAAADLGLAVCIAVVDRGGHLVAFSRMDQAPILSIGIAQDKAYTVAAFGLPTHEWWPLIENDASLLHGIVKTERLIVYAGGVALLENGELVGAVGISGGSAAQDREIAELAAGGFARRTRGH